MKELKRILSNRRFCLGLILILAANGLLFVREQAANDYGLDCSLPQSGVVFVDGSFQVTQEPVDARAAAERYREWLERVRELPPAEAAAFLEEEKTRLAEKLGETDDAGFAGMIGAGSAVEDTESGGTEDAGFAETEDTESGGIEDAGSGGMADTESGGTDDAAGPAGTTDTTSDCLDYIAVNNLLLRTDYLTGYGSWLDNIQANKENLLTFSIFNDPNSFSGRNILQTAKEFEKLQGVSLRLGADGAVNALLSFSLTDYLLTAVLLLFGISFLEERKAGLWGVIHATPRGRLRLGVRRMLLLLFVSACAVLCLYGTDLAIGCFLYGTEGDWGRPVQSVELLGRLSEIMTVGGFLVRFFFLRIAAAFFVSLLLWLLLTAVNNVKYTIIVAAGALAAEYGLYAFLPVQSAFNILKYFNIFTYISLSDLYTNYLNIDLFGWPFGIRRISQLALLPLCVLAAAVCLLVHCRKKPAAGRDLLGRIAYRINRIADKGLCRLHLFGIELYKTLWIQKGAVLAALFVYVAAGLSYTAVIPVTTAVEQVERQYTAEFAGEITGDTFAQMDEEQAELEETVKAYETAKLAYENEEIDFPHLNVYAREAASAQTRLEGLTNVRSRAEELRERGEEEGFAPWLIEEIPFESVYGSRAQENQHRAAMVAVLAMTLLLAGSMAYERQSGMTFLLRSTVRGRGILLRRKLLTAALLSGFVWAVVYGMELHALLTEFSVSAWNAPAQNLSMLTAFPIKCSIAGWMAVLYVCRYLLLFCGAVFVLLISGRQKRLETAYIAAAGILLVPSLLYVYAGLGVFRPFSYIVYVEATPFLTAY